MEVNNIYVNLWKAAEIADNKDRKNFLIKNNLPLFPKIIFKYRDLSDLITFHLSFNLEKINKTLNTIVRSWNREYKQGNRDVANSYGLSHLDLYYYDYSAYIKEYIDKYIRPVLDGV